MKVFIVKRVARIIPLVMLISIGTFALLHLAPGDLRRERVEEVIGRPLGETAVKQGRSTYADAVHDRGPGEAVHLDEPLPGETQGDAVAPARHVDAVD